MAVQGFGRADRDMLGVCAKHLTNRARFAHIAHLGAGAVGIDVIDLAGTHARFGQRAAHRPRLSAGVWLGDVPRVRGVAKAAHFTQDGGTARARDFIFFQHQCAGAFAEQKAAAVAGEGAAGGLGAARIGVRQGAE